MTYLPVTEVVMNNNNKETTLYGRQETGTVEKRGTHSASSVCSRRGLTRGIVVNEWETNEEPEGGGKCQQIMPCVEAQLTKAPRKEDVGFQGKSNSIAQHRRDYGPFSQNNTEINSEVQLRPKRSCSRVKTNGNVQFRVSRPCSVIHSANGVDSHPISYTDRRRQFARRRSTGSFREALEIGYPENEANVENEVPRCGIYAHSIETNRENGKLPRDSIDMLFRRQDSSFDLNPDAEHYPIRRNSTGSTMVYPELPEEDEDDSPIVAFLSGIFNKRDSTDFSLVRKKQIMMQHPSQTERKPFGCQLQTYQSGDGKWFHFLKLDNTPKSMARQLRIRDHDEVLLINHCPVFCLDEGQALVKFLYILRERKIQLVIRRMISKAGGGFEYMEITARIEVDDTLIIKTERSCYSAKYFTEENTYDKWIYLMSAGNAKKYITVRNSTLAMTTEKNNSGVFIVTYYKLIDENFNVYWLCTIQHKQSKKYISAQGTSLQLTAQVQSAPEVTKISSDVRLFQCIEDSGFILLKHYVEKGCFLAYNDSLKTFDLLKSNKPAEVRDYCFFKTTNV